MAQGMILRLGLRAWTHGSGIAAPPHNLVVPPWGGPTDIKILKSSAQECEWFGQNILQFTNPPTQAHFHMVLGFYRLCFPTLATLRFKIKPTVQLFVCFLHISCVTINAKRVYKTQAEIWPRDVMVGQHCLYAPGRGRNFDMTYHIILIIYNWIVY